MKAIWTRAIRLAISIIKKAKRADLRHVELDDQKMDIIIFPSKKWPRMGLIIGREALILDHKTMMAFRVRSGNLGFSNDVFLANCKLPLDKNFISKYFFENQDNPYGIQHIMSMIHRGDDVTTATQFPPLSLPQLTGLDRENAVDRMVKLARKGDFIFSSNLTDPVSAAIRKYDRSQFSHVASYLGNGEVADIGPTGGKINSLYDSSSDVHFALYTFKKELSEASREAMANYARTNILNAKFSYRGIILVFLRNRFKLPVMRGTPSVADLLSGNSFKLVSYF